jgi:AmmeMemoRadiSam system protein A
MDVMGRGAFGELFDFDETFCEKAAECGHRSFVIMAGAFDGVSVDVEKLSHQDVTGVGYGICSFHAGEHDESREFLAAYLDEQAEASKEHFDNADEYVKLAWKSLESYITKHESISIPEGLPKEMLEKQAGAFVSIHENGALRGCIGTILPTTGSVAQEIIDNAVSAATRDPRFDPITPEELPWLEVNVDVLSEPEDIDSPDELDVKKYGVIVSCGSRRGLLLPDLDGVDTVDQQISIAMRKGGIREGENIKLQRFTVTRHV